MKPPAGFSLKIYTTLIKLYADQNNVSVTYEIKHNGKMIKFDTRDPLLSCEEIVKRYGKSKDEIEQGLE